MSDGHGKLQPLVGIYYKPSIFEVILQGMAYAYGEMRANVRKAEIMKQDAEWRYRQAKIEYEVNNSNDRSEFHGRKT